MSNKLKVCSLMVLAAALAGVPALAGSAVVGSVAGSLNASVGGQAVLPHTVIFSGDSLQVKDGALVVAMENGSRMAFGRETTATFQREEGAVTVVLSAGNVSLYHADSRLGLRVQAGGVTVEAAPGYKTLGDVAMVNGAVVVTAKDGALKVNEGGRTLEVAKGKTITVLPKAARAPQTGGSQKLGGGNTALEAGALGAGAAAAILAGVALKRAGDAKDNAAAATTAANTAASDANAATSAANAATSAATAAGATANSVGCALNTLTFSDFGLPSPYTPPSGSTCP